MRWIVGLIATLVASGLLFQMFLRPMYLTPRAEHIETIESLKDSIDANRAALAERDRVAELMNGHVNRTLGGDLETVDHRLRTRLNRIGEQIGLDNLVVNTGRTVRRDTPARRRYRGSAMRQFRERTDFVVHEGMISGEGPFDDVLRLLHRIDSEPWIKRVSNIRLDPQGNGQRFAASLRLETIFVPGRNPDQVPEQVSDPDGFEPYATLAHANPFRMPPEEPPPDDEPEQQQPPPEPPFPYGQWVLTGVIDGPVNPEVWVKRGNSAESRRLHPGDALEDAELVAVHGDAAEFELDGRRFLIRVGRPMNDREPVSR